MTKSVFILLTLIFTCSIVIRGQTSTQPVNATDVLTRLPDSEVVMLVNVKQLFSKALPLITANDQAQLERLSQEIKRFKEQTRIDARDFDAIAALDFSPRLKSLFPPSDEDVIARHDYYQNRG